MQISDGCGKLSAWLQYRYWQNDKSSLH